MNFERRSKRKTTAVVGVENKRKYCRIENDNKILNKKFEGTAIQSEELKQPRFNFDYYFENPNVSLSEEDREYEYGDPVEWNILQSQTSSSLKCDSVDGNCISRISASPHNVFKVKEKEDGSDEDEIINIHAAAATLSNREPEGEAISHNVFKVKEKEECSDEDEIINIHPAAATLSNREVICFNDIKNSSVTHTQNEPLPGESLNNPQTHNEQLCGEVGGSISSDAIVNPETIWLDLEESIPLDLLIIDTDTENSLQAQNDVKHGADSHANSEMKEEYIHPLNGETLTPTLFELQECQPLQEQVQVEGGKSDEDAFMLELEKQMRISVVNPDETIWLDVEERNEPDSRANSEIKEEYIHPLNGETLTQKCQPFQEQLESDEDELMLEKQMRMSVVNLVETIWLDVEERNEPVSHANNSEIKEEYIHPQNAETLTQKCQPFQEQLESDEDELILEKQMRMSVVNLAETIWLDVEEMNEPVSHANNSEITCQVQVESDFMLEKQMRMSVSHFQNELRVDIRYLNCSLRNTVRDLSLPIQQFKAIVNNLSLFDEDFKKMKEDLLPEGEEINISTHLGGKRWMSIQSPYQTVNIRQKYLNQKNEPRLDKIQGVSLRWTAWRKFVTACQTIVDGNINIRNCQPCESTHDSQKEFMLCSNCHPYEHSNYYK